MLPEGIIVILGEHTLFKYGSPRTVGELRSVLDSLPDDAAIESQMAPVPVGIRQYDDGRRTLVMR